MSYQVLARKYRPSTFSEVVGQEHILTALENSIQHNKLHQAYMFSGTEGLEKQQLLGFLLNALTAKKGTCPKLYHAMNVVLV